MCVVDIKTGLSDQEPLFLRPNNQLWIPDGPALKWDEWESTPIACPGDDGKNIIVKTGRPKSTITCVSGTTFRLGDLTEHVDIADIKCQSRPTGSVQNTGQDCGGGGTLLNVGFQVDTVDFVTYFLSCYNMQTASVIYTFHVIAGGAINNKVPVTKKDKKRPAFKAAQVPPDLSPATAYDQGGQFDLFTQLLGSEVQAQYFSTDKSYLSRGHLTPDADGIFRPWRWATYFFVNVAPQWQATNGGNWVEVENAARTVSGRLNEKVLIFTGVHGVLTLPGVDGWWKTITLAAGRIPAPKWYWKVIKSKSKDAAIALVSLNDPFRKIKPWEMLCEDVCNQYGWSNPNYRKFELGYTYCCTVADLRAHIPSIPAEADAAYVLRYDEDIGSATRPVHDELR
ncbi:uncharacterized protein LOC131285335 [Anopheles ziemanni]|uniref:uncharacterized protein LOC131265816 n=1 Tax=Anopheles coustani TaxID=139045 RepID=UPI0026585318|nr:uncharacterized protein LOC131265816 [Anopheles coustani]XP_058170172.1 uncharacterized protein LOC131285335 [Anopheles ziemanni]